MFCSHISGLQASLSQEQASSLMPSTLRYGSSEANSSTLSHHPYCGAFFKVERSYFDLLIKMDNTLLIVRIVSN